jgi:hypothetical protein
MVRSEKEGGNRKWRSARVHGHLPLDLGQGRAEKGLDLAASGSNPGSLDSAMQQTELQSTTDSE